MLKGLLSNPLILGGILIGGGYLALKAGLFDSILGSQLSQEFANDPARLARIRANPNIRPGISAALYGGRRRYYYY